MMRTDYMRTHQLWSQIAEKENETRKQFEYMTGETQADRFFSGQNRPQVDKKLKTCSDWRQFYRSSEDQIS